MLPNEIRKNLKIRKLSIENIEQFNALLKYSFQVSMGELSSIGWSENGIKKSKSPILKKATVFGWFDKNQLISQICIYPMTVNIFGTMYKMGGVTGVGTYPEYAGNGLMLELMKKSLQVMKRKGQTISFLYPYSIPYYRKKGWEIVSDKMTYTIKDTQLPKRHDVPGMVKRVRENSLDLKRLHNEFAMYRHGAILRYNLEWDEYWRWEGDDILVAIYYDVNNKPTGYLVYYLVDEIFKIKEFVYLTQEARHGLWNYISAHFSMINKVQGLNYTNEPLAFLLEDSEISESIEPYIMARIVDFEGFIKKFPFKDVSSRTLHFVIDDPIMECNNGNFSVTWDDDENVVITKGGTEGELVKASIQTLVAMFMGYKRPTYLARIERLEANKRTLTYLEKIIPNEQPYFSDYF